MATYAIGDVHGCYRTMRALLDELPFDRRHDHLWLVGDLVNRGPRSLEVLRWVRDLEAEMGERLVAVLGNHDVHLLALADGLGKLHHRESLDPVLDAAEGGELVEWLRRRPLLHRRTLRGPGKKDSTHLLIHAGLLPEWSAKKAEKRARRAEEILRRPEGLASLKESRAAESKDGHQEEAKTLRVLTRLRMLTREGRMSDHTGTPETGPKGAVSWFDQPDRASSGCVAVTGHWAALGVRLRPDLVALDSGCVYGGTLTAVRLEDRKVFELPNRE